MAWSLAGACVVLLEASSDGVEVVLLGTCDELADAEHRAQRSAVLAPSRCEKSDAGNDAPAPEAERRKLAAGHELIAEGAGDAKQLSRLRDAEDELLRAASVAEFDCREGGHGAIVRPKCPRMRHRIRHHAKDSEQILRRKKAL